jgi:acetyltransferase-like isoleucine patch superfamily enzyme
MCNLILDNIFCLKKIIVGYNVYIGPDAFINAIGGVEIQNRSIIGSFVKIQTSNHRYDIVMSIQN